jgi:hypothetical protein
VTAVAPQSDHGGARSPYPPCTAGQCKFVEAGSVADGNTAIGFAAEAAPTAVFILGAVGCPLLLATDVAQSIAKTRPGSNFAHHPWSMKGRVVDESLSHS